MLDDRLQWYFTRHMRRLVQNVPELFFNLTYPLSYHLCRVVVFGTGSNTYIYGAGGDDYFLAQPILTNSSTGTPLNPIVGSMYFDGQNGNDIAEIALAGGNTVCARYDGSNVAIRIHIFTPLPSPSPLRQNNELSCFPRLSAARLLSLNMLMDTVYCLQPSNFYIDSTGTGTMSLTVEGTPFDDLFVLRPGYIALVNDSAWNPTTGTIGVAQIVYYTPNLNEGLVVNGFDGQDTFACDGTSAPVTLNGMDGDDEFIFGQVWAYQRHRKVTLCGIFEKFLYRKKSRNVRRAVLHIRT